MLGNEFGAYGGGFDDGNAFGGDLFKANVFDKELDASEVKEMADGPVALFEEFGNHIPSQKLQETQNL